MSPAKVSPIAMASETGADDPSNSEMVTLSGWGTTSQEGHQDSPNLLKVNIPVMGSLECKTYYPGDQYDGVICVDTMSGTAGICSVSIRFILNCLNCDSSHILRAIKAGR